MSFPSPSSSLDDTSGKAGDFSLSGREEESSGEDDVVLLSSSMERQERELNEEVRDAVLPAVEDMQSEF